MNKTTKRGVSMVEAVAVLAIATFTVSIFVPLVLRSREKMRQTECANNLHQIGNAWLLHEQAQGHLPSSGWGWQWTGDPDRGFGRTQPGGWAFDAIRFTEFEAIANAGAGTADEERSNEIQAANAHPIPFFYCPSRRPVRSYPWERNFYYNLRGSRNPHHVRIDYAANSGSIDLFETSGAGYDVNVVPVQEEKFRISNGVTTQLSRLRLAQVTDGLSHTMMLAEKYLNPDNYLNGQDNSDDGTAYGGIDRDVNGYTATVVLGENGPEPSLAFLPRVDRRGLTLRSSFGSAHQQRFNVAFCDGSVRQLSYDVNFQVFHALGARNDAR